MWLLFGRQLAYTGLHRRVGIAAKAFTVLWSEAHERLGKGERKLLKVKYQDPNCNVLEVGM